MGVKMGDKRLARDFLAMGSWVFYVLVLGRALIEPFRPFVDQVVIAGMFILVLGFKFRGVDYYVCRMLVLVVFTSLFYYSLVFSGFAFLVGFGVLVSSRFIGNSWGEIGKGLGVGMVAVGIGYFLPGFYLN